VHIKSDRVVQYGDNYPTDFSYYDGLASVANRSSITERDLKGTCRTALTCGYTAASFIGYGVKSTSQALVNKVLQISGTDDIWGFLNQPLVVQLTIGTADAAISGVVSAYTSSRLAASDCSTKGTDADTIVALLQKISDSYEATALQLENLNAAVGDLRSQIQVLAESNSERISQGASCGAPNPDPGPAKRALLFSG
jgi:hypothetical protein